MSISNRASAATALCDNKIPYYKDGKMEADELMRKSCQKE